MKGWHISRPYPIVASSRTLSKPLPLAPLLPPFTGALTGVKGTGSPYKGAGGGRRRWLLILPQVKSRGDGCVRGKQEKCGPTCHWLSPPVRGFSLDLWTSELPHTTNLLINREIPWKNFERPLCVRVNVHTWVCRGERGRETEREGIKRTGCGVKWPHSPRAALLDK